MIKTLIVLAFALVALLAFVRVFNNAATTLTQAPTQRIIQQYYSNTERALNAIGEGQSQQH